MQYAGPPSSTPPPPEWRPPAVTAPAPPRRLPAQDHAAIDAAERAARRVTWIASAGAGAVALVVGCVLLARLLGS